MDVSLESHRVFQAPKTVHYIPEFITVEEESRLIENVNSAPKPKWTQLAHRRLQNWGGIPHPKGMIVEQIPGWLAVHTESVGRFGLFGSNKCPNHVLVNEYLPGQGIMPHLDGPLFYPTVTTISCGSHAILDFYKPPEEHQSTGDKLLSLLLERRSLLVLQDEMYEQYLHTIAEVQSDCISKLGQASIANLDQCCKTYDEGEILLRGTRISLTMRYVARASKFHLKLSK